jgi:hypothetical protein
LVNTRQNHRPGLLTPPVAGVYPFLSSRSSTSYTPWAGRARYCLRFWRAFSLPRSVFGPVLKPPCNRHRPFARALHRQGVPRRVRASQGCFFLPGIASLTRNPEFSERVQGIAPAPNPLQCASSSLSQVRSQCQRVWIRPSVPPRCALLTEPLNARGGGTNRFAGYEPGFVPKKPSRMPSPGGLVRIPTEPRDARYITSYTSYTSYKSACCALPESRAQPRINP